MEENGNKHASILEASVEGGRKATLPPTPKQALEEYAKGTSAHGVKKVVTSRGVVARLVWTLLFLTAIAMIIFQLTRLVQIYCQWPVNVKTKMVSEPMPFPAVTICNLNTVYFSKIQQDEELIGILKAIAERYSIPLENFTLKNGTTGNYSDIVTTDFGSEHPLWEAKQNLKIWLASANEKKLRKMSQPREEFIIKCELAKEPCVRDFEPVKDEDFGICFRWLPKAGENNNVNIQGPASGMTLILNVEEKDYLPFLSSSTGVRVHVHDPASDVLMVEEGASLPTGFETSIGVRPVQTIRLPHPYGDCDANDTHRNLLMCERMCMERAIEVNCNCTRRFVKDGTECFDDDFLCLRQIEEDFYAGRRSCKCKMPCQSQVFEREIAMTVWPSFGTLPFVTKRVNELGLSFTPDDIRSNLLQVNIFFSQLVKVIIEEEPAYQWVNLLSDIGGQLGLWLGISAMSLAELLEFIGCLVAAAIAKLHSKRT